MGFIKKLIAGIISFITGFLPGKKNGGYYLQLEETGTGSAPVAAPKPAVEASNGNGKTAKAAETPKSESASTPVKAAKKEASQNGKTAPSAPAPAPAPVATKPATPTETTFAPKYLIPTASGSNGRRRPGANMSSYLDMARQVKTPG
ncbi:hypothetical protein ACQFX9_06335 [Aliinostoc sp. HNIBRCY26]|uniref:hypothetical protein n=1 Tax=Aliinostoc sp. HNIBRCY26 TaxID=3418997 RepID=UPI003D02C1FD